MRYLVLILGLAMSSVTGCGDAGESDGDGGPAGAGGSGGSGGSVEPSGAVNVEDYMRHVEELSSDAYGGRFPGTSGGQKTVEYLATNFERAGLAPAYDDGFLQQVELLRTEVVEPTPFAVDGESVALSFTHMDDVVLWTYSASEEIGVDDAPVVFAGYGIVAPEYGWDDYGDVDVSGKVVLIIDHEPSSDDEGFFEGDYTSQYWHWDYRFAEAKRRGAIGVIQRVSDMGTPSYGAWGHPRLAAMGDEPKEAPDIVGITNDESLREILGAAGMDYEATIAAANDASFEAMDLGLRASVAWSNAAASVSTANVIGVVPGRVRPDEAVVFVAHWDHLGTDPNAEGDGIYNGAADNATGTAALIEIAEALAALDPPPERSVIIVAATAEEHGKLGARWYVSDPLVSMESTAALFNIDYLGMIGPAEDLVAVMPDSSELGALLEAAATKRDKYIVAAAPTLASRSDVLPFAEAGVPFAFFWNGVVHVENGIVWGLELQRELYHYHTVDDEIDERWDLSGAVESIEIYVEVATEVANSNRFPEWASDSPFQRP